MWAYQLSEPALFPVPESRIEGVVSQNQHATLKTVGQARVRLSEKTRPVQPPFHARPLVWLFTSHSCEDVVNFRQCMPPKRLQERPPRPLGFPHEGPRVAYMGPSKSHRCPKTQPPHPESQIPTPKSAPGSPNLKTPNVNTGRTALWRRQSRRPHPSSSHPSQLVRPSSSLLLSSLELSDTTI